MYIVHSDHKFSPAIIPPAKCKMKIKSSAFTAKVNRLTAYKRFSTILLIIVFSSISLPQTPPKAHCACEIFFSAYCKWHRFYCFANSWYFVLWKLGTNLWQINSADCQNCLSDSLLKNPCQKLFTRQIRKQWYMLSDYFNQLIFRIIGQ